MDQQQRIDRILEAVQTRIQDEVSDLLGGEFFVAGSANELVTKKSAFERLRGKQVCARMNVVGELEGEGFLMVGIKDAIRLGGTLIMLPETELEEVIGREEYSEEIEDSYGEIANIVAGSFSKDFEVMYPQSCRFVRKELDVIVPAKLTLDADGPVADQAYYQMSCSMVLDGHAMGDMVMLLPAAGFGLQLQENGLEESAQPEVQQTVDTFVDSAHGGINEDVQSTSTNDSASHSAIRSPEELEKQQALIDEVLSTCCERVVDEVSALLGTEIALATVGNKFISKKDFFVYEVSATQVIADIDVVGDVEGKSYLAASLRSAIRIGGQLIMLPAAELESVVSAEEFGEDTTDAYGEVVNIIAGVYTRVFEAHYSKHLQFVKNRLQRVAPMQVEVGSEEPLPDQEYYLSSMVLSLGPDQDENLKLLIPCDLVELSRQEGFSDYRGEASQPELVCSDDTDDTIDSRTVITGDALNSNGLDILLISDNEGESKRIQEVVAGMGYSSRVLGIKDNLHNYIPGELKAIYLVMKDVNEQAFGTAIKVSSACSVPIIAAGPGWTRSKVIKAVRYGVRDILLTPATSAEIEENISSNLLQLAA